MIFFILSTNYNTATPGVNLKTQCDLLSKEFDFQHIYLDDILHERSSVETYLHAKFLKECLEEKVIPPVQLAVDSLEWKIKKGIKEGKMWSLVRGFPENINQLVEFKKKVSNYACRQTSFAHVYRSKKRITRCS